MRLPLLLPAAALLLFSCNNDGSSSSSTSSADACDGVISRLGCATCHNPDHDAVGPALRGALAKWDNDTGRLFAYIRNPAAAMQAGDPRAKVVFEQFKPTVMTPFPNIDRISAEDRECLLKVLKGRH